MVIGLYRLYQMIGAILVITSVLIAYGIIPNPIPTTPYKQSGILAIENINVIPMDTERVIENQTLIIRKGRIAVMRDSGTISIPNGAQVVDGTGKYLIPGLMDMEVNLEMYFPEITSEIVEKTLLQFMTSGVTGIRSVFSTDLAIEFRDAIAIGHEEGPRMLATQLIPFFSVDSNGSGEVIDFQSRRQARAQVREVAEAGFDGIDITSQIATEHVLVVLDEANIHDLLVHFAFLKGSNLWSQDFFIDNFIEHDLDGMTGGLVMTGLFDNLNFEREIVLAKLLEKEIYVTTGAVGTDPSFPEALEHVDSGYNLAADLNNLGATLVMGSYHANELATGNIVRTHHELIKLVEIGLTPYEALRTATANISENIESFSDAGVVETGRRADLVILNANPLENIEHVRDIESVIVNGRYLSREIIDQKLNPEE